MAAKSKPKNPIQEVIDKLPPPLKNRYFIVLVLFFAIMVFFDKHNIIVQWQLQQTLNRLEADKAYYEEKLEEAKQMRYDLEVNIEKFAREKYYMKRNDEDVFIIENKN